MHLLDRTIASQSLASLSPEAQAGTAVTCCLSVALAQSCEMPAYSARRPMKCPRVTGRCQGSNQAPIQVSPLPRGPNNSRDGAWRGQTTNSCHQSWASLWGFLPLGSPVLLSLCFLGRQTQNLPIPAETVVGEQLPAPGHAKLPPSCSPDLWPLSTPHSTLRAAETQCGPGGSLYLRLLCQVSTAFLLPPSQGLEASWLPGYVCAE